MNNEINSALYPEDGIFGTRSTDYNHNVVRSDKKTRGYIGRFKDWLAELWGINTLKKEKIMIWDPWGESDFEKYLKEKVPYYKSNIFGNKYFEINGKKIEVDSYYKLDASLNKINDFDSYDVVYVYCHGVPDPNNSEKSTLYYPSVGFFDLLLGRGPNLQKGKNLTKQAIGYLLPEDLSKTVIFTAICWGDLSHLKDIAMDRNCVAFSGANTKIVAGLVRAPFVGFVNAFYAGGNIIDAAKEGLYYEATQLPEKTADGSSIQLRGKGQVNGSNVIMKYTNIEVPKDHKSTDGPTELVSGYYTFRCNNPKARTKNVQAAMSAVSGLPRGSITMPYDQFISVFASREGTRATRESSDNGYSMGFWIRNKETKEEKEIEFSDSTIVIYEDKNNPKYYPKDDNLPKEIVRVEVLGKTDNI